MKNNFSKSIPTLILHINNDGSINPIPHSKKKKKKESMHSTEEKFDRSEKILMVRMQE